MSFDLGRVVVTQNLLAVAEGRPRLLELLRRHESGDWGDLGDDDKRLNELAVEGDDRILSAYSTPWGKVYVITEHDRSYTTIMLAEDY